MSVRRIKYEIVQTVINLVQAVELLHLCGIVIELCCQLLDLIVVFKCFHFTEFGRR